MEITYRRGQLPAQEAHAYQRFVNEAAGTHYMQHLAFGGSQPNNARRFILFESRGKLLGVASMLRGMHGHVRTPYALIERGPVVREPDDLRVVLPALARVARWHGIATLRVQPSFSQAQATIALAAAEAVGYTISNDLDGPYRQTLHIPLGHASPEAIFAGSAHNDLRREARKARQVGASARIGTAADLPRLNELYQAMMNAQGASDRDAAYFLAFAPLVEAGDAVVVLGEWNGELDCAILVMRHLKTATLHLGATCQTRRNYQKMLLPLMTACEWAHAWGAEVFDLGGVPSADDNDPKRRAIAAFKYRFQGTPVTIVPPLHAPITPAMRTLLEAWRWSKQRFGGFARHGATTMHM